MFVGYMIIAIIRVTLNSFFHVYLQSIIHLMCFALIICTFSVPKCLNLFHVLNILTKVLSHKNALLLNSMHKIKSS